MIIPYFHTYTSIPSLQCRLNVRHGPDLDQTCSLCIHPVWVPQTSLDLLPPVPRLAHQLRIRPNVGDRGILSGQPVWIITGTRSEFGTAVP